MLTSLLSDRSLNTLQLYSLHIQRRTLPKSRPCSVSQLADQYLEPAVVRGEEAVRFIIPYARTSAYKYSFFPAAVRLVQHTGCYDICFTQQSSSQPGNHSAGLAITAFIHVFINASRCTKFHHCLTTVTAPALCTRIP